MAVLTNIIQDETCADVDGGNKAMYAAKCEDIVWTVDADGVVTGVALSVGGSLVKFVGLDNATGFFNQEGSFPDPNSGKFEVAQTSW